MKAVAVLTTLLGVAVATNNTVAGAAAAANEKTIMKRQDGATLAKPSSTL